MKKAIFTICALSLAHLGLSAQEEQGVIPSLVGWSYYGGDEFNGTSIDKSLWGIYGDKTKRYMEITRNKAMHRLIVTKWLR